MQTVVTTATTRGKRDSLYAQIVWWPDLVLVYIRMATTYFTQS